MIKKLLFIIFILLPFVLKAQTYVTVIGVVHNPTDNINSHDLYKELNKIKPDIILLELDNSLMSSKGEFLKSFNGLEFDAAKRLSKDYPVIFRPFDYKDRNKFYKDNNIFDQENKMGYSLDSAYRSKSLGNESSYKYENFLKVNDILNTINNGTLQDINSITAQKTSELRQSINYDDILTVLNSTKSLNRWSTFWKQDGDFWTFRNKSMLDNILSYCNEFKGKKIVVLTGGMHKYKLIRGLTENAKTYNLILKDFWEY